MESWLNRKEIIPGTETLANYMWLVRPWSQRRVYCTFLARLNSNFLKYWAHSCETLQNAFVQLFEMWHTINIRTPDPLAPNCSQSSPTDQILHLPLNSQPLPPWQPVSILKLWDQSFIIHIRMRSCSSCHFCACLISLNTMISSSKPLVADGWNSLFVIAT